MDTTENASYCTIPNLIGDVDTILKRKPIYNDNKYFVCECNDSYAVIDKDTKQMTVLHFEIYNGLLKHLIEKVQNG